MSRSALLGISLTVAPVLSLVLLVNFGLKPGLMGEMSTYAFCGIPLVTTFATFGALRASRHRTPALVLALATAALSTYALTIDAGSALFALPSAWWTVIGLLLWRADAPDKAQS